MRYLAVWVICAVFILSSVIAYAAPVGNIATPAMLKKGLCIKDEGSKFGFIVGPEIDVVTNRKLKEQSEHTEFDFYGAKAGVVLFDKAYVYGLLGAANAQQEFSILDKSIKWKTDDGICWGGGATAVLFENDAEIMGYDFTARLGVDARLRYTKPDVGELRVDTVAYNLPSPNVTAAVYEMFEWQAAAAVSFQFGRFAPYFGAKYCDVDGRAKAIVNGVEYKNKLAAKNTVGVFVGGDIIVIKDTISVNFEGRLIDEEAISANAMIRF